MPAPIENARRIEIIYRHQQGETLRSISTELNMSYDTVRALWQHYTRHGKVEPNYEKAQKRGTRRFPELQQAAIALKRAHPRWGAALITLKLQKEGHSVSVSQRTLQRWFREANLSAPPPVRQVRQPTVRRGKAAHQVWAVDAKEQIPLADGSFASWLAISDEASGAILHTDVFPPQALAQRVSK